MRSIQFAGPGTAVMACHRLPFPGDNEALVQTSISALSAGTERMWFNGTASALRSGRRRYPYSPGYAMTGTVSAAGKDFVGLSVGDRVFAMKPHASHALLKPQDYWFKLPDHLSGENALATALTATCVHAIHRSAITVGDPVAVAGLGMLGLLMIQVLRATVGGPVVALTRSAGKLHTAHAAGATHACTYDDFGALRASLPPLQSVFECSGAAQNVGRILGVPRAQGSVVLAGFYSDPIPLDGETIFANELSLIGVRATGSNEEAGEYNRWSRRRNLAFAFELVSSGKVTAEHLVSHRFAAGDFAQAYKLIDSPEDFLLINLRWAD